MTTATRTFLIRLRKFLEASPPAKRLELFATYQEITGTKLHRRNLDHWLRLDRGITLCCALPLLRFMQLNDQIVPGTKESGLFHYVLPEKSRAAQERVRQGKEPPRLQRRRAA